MTNIIPLITAGAVWSKVWPILIAILFFGLLIFFHELGPSESTLALGVDFVVAHADL